MDAPTTELGVLSRDEEDEGADGGQQLRGRLGASSSAAAARFTLSDEEEHPSPMQGGGSRGPSRQPTINVDAAQQGVVVEPLPTPVTPAPIHGAPQ